MMIKRISFFLIFNLLYISFTYAADFDVVLEPNRSLTDCSKYESAPSDRFIKSVFKRHIVALQNNGLSANILETHMLVCIDGWETKLLEWQIYDKDYYDYLLKYLTNNFKHLKVPIDVFPLTIKTNEHIYNIARYPCKSFYKSINSNVLYIGMCEEKVGEIIIRYSLHDKR